MKVSGARCRACKRLNIDMIKDANGDEWLKCFDCGWDSKKEKNPIPVHCKSVSEIHKYWENPDDGTNKLEFYLTYEEKSQIILDLINKYTPNHKSSILEIGCNVGRNINYLFQAGFENINGIEINNNAVDFMKKHYSGMTQKANIINSSIEKAVKQICDKKFDVVFTMAVLEHIHDDSEWVFADIARITNDILITIEDEFTTGWRHFPRDYKKVFESLGMKQIESNICVDVPGLGETFFARAFKRG